jgi:hypothetical protein
MVGRATCWDEAWVDGPGIFGMTAVAAGSCAKAEPIANTPAIASTLQKLVITLHMEFPPI